MILICAHAGLKTGEDGPTHADPQALQLLQGNFPKGVAITLTPWEPQEIWTLLCAALGKRPALIAPFVTRPSETVLHRRALGLAPAEDAAAGVYLLRRPGQPGDGTIILQESAVTYAFVQDVLPLLDRDGIAPSVYYVSSAELFDLLPEKQQGWAFPAARAREAMGITGFTLPTMERWLHSEMGRALTLHPYAKGHFLGSGPGELVLAEAGLDGEGQYQGDPPLCRRAGLGAAAGDRGVDVRRYNAARGRSRRVRQPWRKVTARSWRSWSEAVPPPASTA